MFCFFQQQVQHLHEAIWLRRKDRSSQLRWRPRVLIYTAGWIEWLKFCEQHPPVRRIKPRTKPGQSMRSIYAPYNPHICGIYGTYMKLWLEAYNPHITPIYVAYMANICGIYGKSNTKHIIGIYVAYMPIICHYFICISFACKINISPIYSPYMRIVYGAYMGLSLWHICGIYDCLVRVVPNSPLQRTKHIVGKICRL